VDAHGRGRARSRRLAEGLRAAAVRGGARLFEHTPALGMEEGARGRVVVRTPHGRVRARRVLLATSAYPPLVRAVRRYVVPVYDHVLVTEPLSAAQRDAIGWSNRQGVSDSANRFHYYRLTADDRILWGGYDALYRPAGRWTTATTTTTRPSRGSPSTSSRRSRNWRGCASRTAGAAPSTPVSRFSVFFGTAMGGASPTPPATRAWASAPRAGGRTWRWTSSRGRERKPRDCATRRRRPVPFPPEPLRTAVVRLTQDRLAAADRDGGRRGAWLRTLDALGLGFDS
jgi:hypothetical protein